MDSAARLITVACVSVAVGFMLNDARQTLANKAYAATLVDAEEFVPETQAGALLPDEAAPIPVPMLSPTVSYSVSPVDAPSPVVEEAVPVDEVPVDAVPVDEVEAILAQLVASHAFELEGDAVIEPAAAPDTDDLDSDEPLLENDYVAALLEEGASVDQGFGNLEPGTLTRMTWWAGESLYGASIPTPVLVAEGMEEGPTLCITAAVHGDELNGIETVRQLMYSVDPSELRGRLIGVPIVNIQGFERHSRYLPDRRDLNRFFPGNPRGSSASRIAYSFFEKVLKHCNALVDLHTGSFHRTNLPQLRANLEVEAVVNLTKGFGSTVILHSRAGSGTLRGAAVIAGIPTVTLEAGEPLRVDAQAVDHSVNALFTLLDTLGMYDRRSFWGNPEPTYYRSMWVRADNGGILLSQVKLGRRVRTGDQLGTVTDPITNSKSIIRSPNVGRVIGMALNQFVMPGYAAYHIGVESPTFEGLPDDSESTHTDEDHPVAQYQDLSNDRDDSEE